MDSETAAAFELFMAESQQASSSSRTVVQNCHSELTSGHPWSPSSRLSAVLFSAVITQSAAVNAASHQRWLLVFIVQQSLSVLFIAVLSWLSPDIVTLCCIWAWQNRCWDFYHPRLLQHGNSFSTVCCCVCLSFLGSNFWKCWPRNFILAVRARLQVI